MMTNQLFSPQSVDDRDRMPRWWSGWSTGQWVTLISMAGVLVAIVGTLFLVLRTVSAQGAESSAVPPTVGPTPTPTPPTLVQDAVPTPSGLYWPPKAQPLATPNAPGDLLWWDARCAYRQQVILDVVASQTRAGTWARVILDGEGLQGAGKMRADGSDLRVLVWDGFTWWEIPRRAQPRPQKRGWNVLFHLQGPELARQGRYYLYYGNPLAGPAPAAEDAPELSRLLLVLADEETVEWGPQIAWAANSPHEQTVVSPDGRIVITCPPGDPREAVSVRLRTVPLEKRTDYGGLPDYELHVDPPLGYPGPDDVVHWEPPLTVTINWAGLPVEVADLERWVRFAFEPDSRSWYSIPFELDRERGLIRFKTDQP
jgi:hypothetical protein